MEHKFRTPVKCQNGHKGFWYWRHSKKLFLDIETIQKPENDLCGCTKFGLGEGWFRDGDDQMFIGLTGKKGVDIYQGDIVLYDDEHRDKSIVVFKEGSFKTENVGGSFPGECWTFNKRYIDEYEVIGSTHLTPELIP